MEKACFKKKKAAAESLNYIEQVNVVNEKSMPKLEVPLEILGQTIRMELDTAMNGNLISKDNRRKLGRPELQQSEAHYESAS